MMRFVVVGPHWLRSCADLDSANAYAADLRASGFNCWVEVRQNTTLQISDSRPEKQ